MSAPQNFPAALRLRALSLPIGVSGPDLLTADDLRKMAGGGGPYCTGSCGVADSVVACTACYEYRGVYEAYL